MRFFPRAALEPEDVAHTSPRVFLHVDITSSSTRQFSNMTKLMSSSPSHFQRKKKSGHDFTLRLRTLDPERNTFQGGEALKRQHVITSSCQGVPGICTLYVTRKKTQHLVHVRQRAAKKWLFICQGIKYPLDLSSEQSSTCTANIDSRSNEHSRI